MLWTACALLLTANIVNIAADLGGMADVTSLLTGIDAVWRGRPSTPYSWRVSLLDQLPRHRRIFKWLTLALFAYVAAAILAHPDWVAVLRATLIPSVQWTATYWAHALVGHPRHHHLPLPVLLAGRAGSRGGESGRTRAP
ncbi:MAG: divalent metal cation transporter [Paludibaculum sp.]